MAWFSKKDAPQSGLRALSQERIEQMFKDNAWVYTIDDDGDLAGRWDHTVFYFFRSGPAEEVLNVSSRFLLPIPEDKVEDTRLFIEDWHRDHLWPKAYTVVDNDGNTRVSADVALDYEHGVTDEQLVRHAKCAIGTTLQMTEALMEALGLEWNEDGE